MKTIPLTQGFVALVDDEDFERVSAFKWFIHKAGNSLYAAHDSRVRLPRKGPGKRRLRQGKVILLHRFLLRGSKYVHHRDGNGLNNQKTNLLGCTQQQNLSGFQLKRGTTSKYRGVCHPEGRRKWKAQITVGYKTIYLGTFDSETDAARAYDAASRRYSKEFSAPNFP